MASNSKSGLSKLEREDFLKDHGFKPKRNAAGSHEIWEHLKLKELALTHNQKISCPPNLLNNPHQLAWEHTVPDDPATGTWHRIAKHAEWCEAKAAEFQEVLDRKDRQGKLEKEFRAAQKEICDWKRETKHRLKAGLDANPAPASYHRMYDPKPA